MPDACNMSPTISAVVEQLTSLRVELGVIRTQLDAVLADVETLKARDRRQDLLLVLVASGGVLTVERVIGMLL